MKRVLKIVSVALVLVGLVTTSAPATLQAYAAKEFTFAEQKTKKQVTELEMKPEDKVDLCFKGVANYMQYTYTWLSSNEEVATVDRYGVITAKSQGTTEISLQVGDGSAYTAEPVLVTVISMDITAGNSSNKAMSMEELKQGKTLDLNFYGVTDWSERKGAYLTEWVSSDETVVAVNQENGVVTAVSEGIAVIVFQIYDMEKNILLASRPVTVKVTK